MAAPPPIPEAPDLLAIESVGRSGSVALCAADGRLMDFIALAQQPAAAALVPAITGLIDRYGLPRRIAVAAGPGSFTGLRIGVVAARTLAWCDQLPVLAVPTLAALACQQGDGCWWTLLPLKKDVTFHACYRVQGGRWEELSAPLAVDDAALPELAQVPPEALAVGPALQLKEAAMQRWCGDRQRGSADDLDARGVAVAAACCPAQAAHEAFPNYYRKSAPELQRGW